MELSLGHYWHKIVSFIQSIWEFQITQIDGSPLLVSNIILALVFFSLGLSLSRILSHIIKDKFLSRFKMNPGAVTALHTISFYLFVLFFTIIALKFAHVPLTLFTLIGGALAIGFGFGSQNLLNNFISGLILLIERPIRSGDMIEVQNTYGKVIHIGPRCTHVRTFTNIDILVPNSSFLENNLVNWTLTDDQVRTSINVGVVYGSPTRQVRELINQAVTENEKVIKTPEPVILFTEFGDNSLNFEVHFWIRMQTQMDRRIVESDIRYRIDDLFREANIIIAFPQRDIHLDTMRPLEIKVLDSKEGRDIQ
jgi:potassium-dependent mechanosensitive channel